MEAFLRRSCTAVKADACIHVVLGNESCDLDSVMSSLALAYFLHRTSSQRGGSAVVPVLNIPRSDFLRLHTASLTLLREAEVPPESLLFRDELDLARLHGDERLRLTLVDPGTLPSSDSGLEGAIVERIGRRRVARDAPASCPVGVETAGTCAAVVTERILAKAPEILDRNLALMLYGAMAGDSANLSPEAASDGPVVELLETRFPDLPLRGALYQDLLRARSDHSGLTLAEILLKDKKTVSGGDLRIAVSGVYETLELFLQRKFLQQELCEFCHTHRVGALVAMTISVDNPSNEPARGLAIYSSSSLYRQEIGHALLNAQSPSLRLSPLSSPYKDILAYRQGDGRASRETLLPVLEHFLSQRGCRGADDRDRFDRDRFDRDRFDLSGGGGGICLGSLRRRRPLPGAGREEEEGEEEEEEEEEEEGRRGRAVPSTPMNSLVDGCPLDAWLSQDALMERFSRMGGGEEEEGEGEEEEEEEEEMGREG